MVELGIRIQVADRTDYWSKEWFDLDDRLQWDLVWEYLYKEDENGEQGIILGYESDYFTELEISETTELNDIYETYSLMDKLSETERDIARHIYDSGEWSGSLNDLLKLLSERE